MVSQNCIDILLELKKHLPLIAITNGNAEPELIGLGGIFDYVIRPQNEVLMKPDQGIFLKACELLNLPAQNIAHDVSLLRKRFLADLLTNAGVEGANSKALQAYE